MSTDARQRLYRVEAIVLRRQDMGEADRLLTCFCRHHGKLRLMAKGTRKVTSRKAGQVELFSHAQFLVARGRTWDIVTQAEGLHAFLPLREDLLRTSYAYYVTELLDRFTEEQDENEELFQAFLDALVRLSEARELRLPTRYFELVLLDLAGFKPELFTCLGCGESIQPTANWFSSEQGGICCPSCGERLAGTRPISLAALKVLRYMQTRPYTAIDALTLSEGVQREVEDVLYHYLTYVLEQNLKSIRFIRLLREQMTQAAAGHPPAAISESDA